MRAEKHVLTLEKEKIELVDDLSSLLLLKASLHLSDSGTALFILPPKFLFDRNERRVIQNLNRFGSWIHAVFHLPNGTFSRFAQIMGLLFVVKKQEREKVFVGEISSDINQQKVTLRNLHSHKAGKSPQLGALVDLKNFYSFTRLVHEYEVDEISKTMGVSPISISDISVEINLPKHKADE